jgi:hypothetical protein
MMLPMVIGMMTASMLSGLLISKTGRPRVFPIFGSAIFTVGMFLMTQVSADSHLWLVMIYMAIIGYGVGNCMQPLILTVQSAVPPQAIGVATASATFFRQIGGTLGVAVFLSILFSSVGANIATHIREDAQTQAWQQVVTDPDLDPNSLDGQVVASLHGRGGAHGGVLGQVQDDSSIIDRMNPVLAHPFKAGFAESMDTVFRIAALVGVLAFLVLLLLPRVELRATSAQAAARAQAGGTAAAPADQEA